MSEQKNARGHVVTVLESKLWPVAAINKGNEVDEAQSS
ncbi:hypothetical protein APV28_1600 [Comamonas testosteroni]|nr:hypothetical protein APV28_1600 [Comamonas testosteroni]